MTPQRNRLIKNFIFYLYIRITTKRIPEFLELTFYRFPALN